MRMNIEGEVGIGRGGINPVEFDGFRKEVGIPS